MHGEGTYDCTPITVNVFETGITLRGRSEVSLAATTPCRLQLCAVWTAGIQYRPAKPTRMHGVGHAAAASLTFLHFACYRSYPM